MKNVEFIFDFGSPNAYLAWRVLPGMVERAGATLTYAPCLLGGIFKATGNQSPLQAFADIKGKLAYQRLEMRRFIERHELHEFSMNPHFPINTLLIMRGLIAAQAAGVEQAYIQAIQSGMWEQGKKMDAPDVVAAVLGDAGLDGNVLLEATQQPHIKQQLIDNTQAAVDRGVFGIPTFFVGDEMFFGKDRLPQVVEQL